jgi:hypothetical protein
MSDRVAALSVPGRSADTEGRQADAKVRNAGQKVIEEKILRTMKNRSVNATHAKLDVNDIVWANPALCFVGCGMYSNQAGFDYCLDEKVFDCKVIAHVRDIFDLDPNRAYLNSVFLFASNDVTIVNEAILEPMNRRLVNEYVRNEKDEYELARHDIEFDEYIHSRGLRIIPSKKHGAEFQQLATTYIPVQQSTNHVLMVAPTAFVKNIQAAEDNYFMNDPNFTPSEESDEQVKRPGILAISESDKKDIALQRQVIREFSELHRILTEKARVQVHLFTHEAYHDTPDACFPNNWFSTHTDLECGECTLVLYPMKVPNRRKERRPEFIKRLESFQRYTHVLDLTRQERASKPSFLEGTGSLVLDRMNRIAYVALSERSDLSLANKWGRMMQYEVVSFHATDAAGRPIYHTNVVMSVGTSVGVLCTECIENPEERKKVKTRLEETRHEVVEITRDQVNHFCGNVLELENYKGYPVLAMSTQAYNAFTPEQREILLKHQSELLHAEFSTIERVGGGGVRCALAELF